MNLTSSKAIEKCSGMLKLFLNYLEEMQLFVNGKTCFLFILSWHYSRCIWLITCTDTSYKIYFIQSKLPVFCFRRSEIADKASRAGAARKALLLSFKAAAQLIEEGYSLEDRVRLRKRALRARLEVEKLERDRLLELLNPTEQNRIGEKPKMVKLTQLLMEQQHQQQGKPGAGAGASGTDAASPLSTLLALAKK